MDCLKSMTRFMKSMSAKHTLMTTLPVFLRGAEVLSIVLSYDPTRQCQPSTYPNDNITRVLEGSGGFEHSLL
ncbi:hypothetical protein J6590_096745 [Homalodisca vitripennis]|nr:hypothetical protein J6590_096745 [Homalodisca vitripennis]